MFENCVVNSNDIIALNRRAARAVAEGVRAANFVKQTLDTLGSGNDEPLR